MENVAPVPSPPPRLRRSPKRRALHERSQSDVNVSPPPSPPSPLGTSIRAVAADDADVQNVKIYATSPFPTALVQRLPPPAEAQGRTRGRPPTAGQPPVGHPAGVRVSRRTSDASSARAANQLVNARTTTRYDANRPRTPSPRARVSCDGPAHPPSSITVASFDSSPPWIVISSPPDEPSPASAAARSLDVDRRAMAERVAADGDPPPTFLADSPTSDEVVPPSFLRSSPTSEEDVGLPDAPRAPHAHQYATPRPASRRGASREETPMTTSSVGSADTVQHRQHLTGALPASHFSRFPPGERTPPAHLSSSSAALSPSPALSSAAARARAAPLSPASPLASHPTHARRSRSSSDPPPRVATLAPPPMDVSPASSGSPGSPVSPMWSPVGADDDDEDEEREARGHNIYLHPSRTASLTALDLQVGDVRIPIQRPTSSPSGTNAIRRSAPGSLFNRLASAVTQPDRGSSGTPAVSRSRPLFGARSNSARIVSVMSTIHSEGTAERDDRSSSDRRSLSAISSAGVHHPRASVGSSGPHHQQESLSSSGGGTDLWGMGEQFPTTPRSPRLHEDGGDYISHIPLSAPPYAANVPAPPPPVLPPPRRASTGLYDKELPPLPEVVSPKAALSRDEKARTRPRRASSPELQQPALSPVNETSPAAMPATPERRRTSTRFAPPSPLSRHNSKRDSGNSFRRFRESLPAWARTYYANEPRHRATIGTGLSPIVDASEAPARPRTIAAAHLHPTRPESLRMSRSREQLLLEAYYARERAIREAERAERINRASRQVTSRYARFPPSASLEPLGAPEPEQGLRGRSARRSGTPPFPLGVEELGDDSLQGAEAEEFGDEHVQAEHAVHSTPSSPRSSSPPHPLSASEATPEPALLGPAAYDRHPVSDGSMYSRPYSEEQQQQRRIPRRPVSDQRGMRASGERRPVSDMRSRMRPVDQEGRAAEHGSVERGAADASFAAPLAAATGPASSWYDSNGDEDTHATSPRASHPPDHGGRLPDAAASEAEPTALPRSSTGPLHSRDEYFSPRSSRQLRDARRSQRDSHRSQRDSQRRSRDPRSGMYSPSHLRASQLLSPPVSPLHVAAPTPRLPPNLDHDPDWSPHLWHDRRSTMLRRSRYIEPSISESLEGHGPTRRNVQVWLFALGFVMPLCWMVAAFLPLPGEPQGPAAGLEGRVRDLEKMAGEMEGKRFENARWWRNVNRGMCPVGVAVLVAVVVLVVVASKGGM